MQQKVMYTRSKGSIFVSIIVSLDSFGSFSKHKMGTYMCQALSEVFWCHPYHQSGGHPGGIS